MIISLTCDGSCWPNPGPGGWACVFRANGVSKSLYGFDPKSTNNRMELTAAIRGLEHLKRECQVQLFCDSEYVVKGITQWIRKWKRNGWITGDFRNSAKNTPGYSAKEVKNRELWERLDIARSRHSINWVHVKGHASHQDNLLCDQIARRAGREQIQGTAVLSNINLDNIVEEAKKSEDSLIRTITFEDI